jgi:hypothetical protein
MAATEKITRRWRRDVLAPGLHRPFWRCLLDQSIPVAQAGVIRRAAIDWQDFPAEVGAVWDPWLGYLACRTGKACYYLPERLTRYRVHGDSWTSTTSEDGSLGMILLYSRLMAMPELAAMRGEIAARCAEAYRVHGLFLLQAGRAREARKELRRAIALGGPTAESALAFALAAMPGTLGAAMLRALRRARRRRRG